MYLMHRRTRELEFWSLSFQPRTQQPLSERRRRLGADDWRLGAAEKRSGSLFGPEHFKQRNPSWWGFEGGGSANPRVDCFGEVHRYDRHRDLCEMTPLVSVVIRLDEKRDRKKKDVIFDCGSSRLLCSGIFDIWPSRVTGILSNEIPSRWLGFKERNMLYTNKYLKGRHCGL